MSDDVLRVAGLCKSFGALVVADDVSLGMRPGEIHALIGPNGAGKTTLMSLIHGSLRPDAGRISLRGDDVTRLSVTERVHLGLARTFQISSLLPEMTVAENVGLSLIGHARHALRFFDGRASRLKRREAVMAELARTGLQGLAHDPVASLSHGQKRRLELAMAMVRRPAVLLADEPLAGLGAEGVHDLVGVLRELKRQTSILLVEHDMDAVFAAADRISVLVRGQVIASGTPSDVRANRDVQQAYLGEDDLP